jgi:hypothetical protein
MGKVFSWAGAVTLAGLLAFGSPAEAHQTSLNATLTEVVGSPSPIELSSSTRAKVSLSSSKGGRIRLKLRKTVDSLGAPIDALGNALELDLVVNGAPQSVSLPFDIENGNGKAELPTLGLVSPDLIEILDIRLVDQNADAFAALGFSVGSGPSKALSSALIQVVGASPIFLAATRDADITLRTVLGGLLTARFDKLADIFGLPINDAGCEMQLELTVNGVNDLRTVSFDIIGGDAHIQENLGLSEGDVVEIERIDFYDSGGDRFATLGVRIQNP